MGAPNHGDYLVPKTRGGARRRPVPPLTRTLSGFGPKVFFYRYRSRDGALRKMKLGEVGPLTLSKARDAALRKRLEREQGKDPQPRLLTGCRSGEVVAGRWRDIDLERGVWTIRETKNGDARCHAAAPGDRPAQVAAGAR